MRSHAQFQRVGDVLYPLRLLTFSHSFVPHSQLDKGSLCPICQAAYLIYVYWVYLCDENPKDQMLYAAVIAVIRSPWCLPSSINILLALSGTAHSENWGSPKTLISTWREQFAHNISSVKTNKQQSRDRQNWALLASKYITCFRPSQFNAVFVVVYELKSIKTRNHLRQHSYT